MDFLGIPAVFHERIQRKLLAQGVNISFDSIKGGLLREFRLSDVLLRDGSGRKAPAMATAEEVRFDFSVWSWLLRRPALQTATFKESTIFVPFEQEPENKNKIEINLDLFELNFQSKESIEIPRFSANLGGLKIIGDARFSNIAVAKTDTVLSWERFPLIFQPVTQRELARLNEIGLEKIYRSESPPQVEISLAIDLEKPSLFETSGLFYLPVINYEDLVLQNIHGTFQKKEKIWRISDLQAESGGHLVKGNITYNSETDKLHLAANGVLSPTAVDTLTEYQAEMKPAFLTDLGTVSPFRFRLNFKGPMHTPEKGELDAEFKARNIFLRAFPFLEAGGRIKYKNNLLSFSDAYAIPAASPLFNHNGTIKGHGTYNVGDKKITGQLKASVTGTSIRALLKEIPSFQNTLLDDFHFSRETSSFSLTLNESPLPLKKWRGHLSTSISDLRFRDIEIENISADIDFKKGTIFTSQKPLSIIHGKEEEKIFAEFLFNTRDGTINGQARGTLYPLDLFRNLRLTEGRTKKQLRLFRQTKFLGPPLAFDIQFDNSSFPFLLDNWRIKGKWQASEIEFDNLFFQSGEGEVQIADSIARFDNLQINTPDFQQFQLDYLETSLTSLDISLAGTLIGDPKKARVFIDTGNPRRSFNRAWENFQWPESPPTIVIEHFNFKKKPDPEHRWQVKMVASIESDELEYRGLDLSNGTAKIILDLPETLKIEQLWLQSNKEEQLSGEIEFDLQGDPKWSFNCRGELNPILIFEAAGIAGQESLKKLQFNQKTRMEMSGTVWMRGGNHCQLTGNFSGNELKVFNFNLDSFDLAWEMSGHNLQWQLQEGEMHGGPVVSTGNLNTFTNSGDIYLLLEEVDLASLLRDWGVAENETDLGRLTATARLDFQHWKLDSSLNLTGKSKVTVKDGKFWEAPILKNLGDAVGLPRLGRISTLEAELDFYGDRVEIPSLRTDGTIFSLEGQGKYNWDTQYINFLVRGRALQKTAFIGIFLRPLSWLFEAKLEGKMPEAEWSTVPLGGLMSSD